jgi:mannose-1-phosphate guanylyltransferase
MIQKLWRPNCFLIGYAQRFLSTAAVETAIRGVEADLEFVMLNAFGRTTAKSIDYAVIERTDRAAVRQLSQFLPYASGEGPRRRSCS